jgi:hypothetical protein
LEAELFIEQVGERFVTLRDSAVQAQRMIGFECDAPAWLVEVVDGDGALGCLEWSGPAFVDSRGALAPSVAGYRAAS